MHSSWNHATDHVWRRLDPVLWRLTRNPWTILQTVSREKLQGVLADPVFRRGIDDLVQSRRDAVQAPAWFQQTYPQSRLTGVAYFSMEFMLSEALPIYSGGLGNVAGDQLKAASDLGVPVIGVGLLYQQGYFRQVIDKDGAQQAMFPYNDPGQLPITPLRQANGEGLRLEIALPGSGRQSEALPARQQRRGELPRASWHHQRALRRRAGAAPQAGATARHRRLATARGPWRSAGSLPPE
jgi:starch phosphorylase